MSEGNRSCLVSGARLIFTRVIEYINTKEGVEWVTMEQICDDFKSKNTPPEGALLPAKHGLVLGNKSLQLEKQPAHHAQSANLAAPW